VSILQKTIKETKDDAIFFIAAAILVYFISYFFIFINENPAKIITLDYATALMSFIPTLIFFAAILLFYKFFKSKSFNLLQTYPKTT
jgi:hypothetical protein